MNNTSPDIRERLHALLMALPEDERGKAAFEMFDVARDQIGKDIRASNPGIPNYEVRAKVFERTYGSEFTPLDRGRISEQIRTSRAARRGDWG